MRTRLRSKISLLFMMLGLLIAVPAVALADNIQDNIADNVASSLQLTAGDANSDKTAEIRVIGNNSMQDPDNGCNFDPSTTTTESLTISFTTPSGVTATAVDGATATPGQMQFTACGVDQTVKLSASSSAVAGNYTVTANIVNNNTGGGTFANQVSIPITVNAPADTTAPTVTATAVKGDAPGFTGATTYAADTWTNKDVRVTFTCADNAGGSGLTAASGNQVKTFTTETNETTATFDGTCKDNAGNTAAPSSFGPIKIDKTNPTIDGAANPAPNGAGWNNTNVTVSFVCDDALSGVASCPADVTLSSDGADQSVTRSATDNAGNSASATVGNIDIDKTKPSVSVTGVTDDATYTTGNVPTPGCNTTDGLSGVKTDATVDVTGGTGGFGTLTATCSGAEDNADNAQAAPVSVTYGVKAAFDGFLQPIDGHSVNTGKFGRTYPIKWQLRDDAGNLISDSAAQLLVGTMTGGQKAVSCTSFDLSDTDQLESSTTGGTSLRYDATSDQFIYNYKAPSTGSCYVFAIRNADGLTTQQIDFKFTK
jgi:hypothetical protein